MIFSSTSFIVFFLVVFACYWGLRLLPISRKRIQRLRVGFLLLASYFFYGSWDYRFLGLIWFTTLADFFLGLAIFRAAAPQARFHRVALSVIINLTFLGIFKYFNFFVGSFQQFAGLIGFKTDPVLLHIIL